MLRVILDFWKAYGEKIAFYQTLVILTVIYVLIIGPTWLVAQLIGHRFLPQLGRDAAGYWHSAQMGRVTNIEDLRRQG